MHAHYTATLDYAGTRLQVPPCMHTAPSRALTEPKVALGYTGVVAPGQEPLTALKGVCQVSLHRVLDADDESFQGE
jgi:hypothetical protein